MEPKVKKLMEKMALAEGDGVDVTGAMAYAQMALDETHDPNVQKFYYDTAKRDLKAMRARAEFLKAKEEKECSYRFYIHTNSDEDTKVCIAAAKSRGLAAKENGSELEICAYDRNPKEADPQKRDFETMTSDSWPMQEELTNGEYWTLLRAPPESEAGNVLKELYDDRKIIEPDFWGNNYKLTARMRKAVFTFMKGEAARLNMEGVPAVPIGRISRRFENSEAAELYAAILEEAGARTEVKGEGLSTYKGTAVFEPDMANKRDIEKAHAGFAKDKMKTVKLTKEEYEALLRPKPDEKKTRAALRNYIQYPSWPAFEAPFKYDGTHVFKIYKGALPVLDLELEGIRKELKDAEGTVEPKPYPGRPDGKKRRRKDGKVKFPSTKIPLPKVIEQAEEPVEEMTEEPPVYDVPIKGGETEAPSGMTPDEKVELLKEKIQDRDKGTEEEEEIFPIHPDNSEETETVVDIYNRKNEAVEEHLKKHPRDGEDNK
jgi:hypothetical protein